MVESISSAVFRDALAQFATGVTVVCARAPRGLAGFTATGFTSVSLSPPLVLVCVGRDASAHDEIVKSEHFGVSVLDERQWWMAVQFARSKVDRFQHVPIVTPAPAGVPLIDGAIAQLQCRRHALHEAGDHTILIGEVVAASASPGRPLVHFSRRFGAFGTEIPAPNEQPFAVSEPRARQA